MIIMNMKSKACIPHVVIFMLDSYYFSFHVLLFYAIGGSYYLSFHGIPTGTHV